MREARPLVRDLQPGATSWPTATPGPDAARSPSLNHFFNLLGYNPNGREGPSKAGREEGYLFWLAWLQHNGAALFSTSDANGAFRPVTLGAHAARVLQASSTERATRRSRPARC